MAGLRGRVSRSTMPPARLVAWAVYSATVGLIANPWLGVLLFVIVVAGGLLAVVLRSLNEHADREAEHLTLLESHDHALQAHPPRRRRASWSRRVARSKAALSATVPSKAAVGHWATGNAVQLAEFIGGFAVFMLAMIGVVLALEPSPAAHPYLRWVGGLALILATGIMFVTAEHWAGFLPGFMFLPAILRGMNEVVAPSRLPRGQAALLILYGAIVIALLWRFVPPRRAPATSVDRAAITVFALSWAAIPEWGKVDMNLEMIFLFSALAPLMIAWAVHLRGASHHRTLRRTAAPAG